MKKKLIFFLMISVGLWGVVFVFSPVGVSARTLRAPELISPAQDSIITAAPFNLQWRYDTKGYADKDLPKSFNWEIYKFGGDLTNENRVAAGVFSDFLSYNNISVNISLANGKYLWRTGGCQYNAETKECYPVTNIGDTYPWTEPISFTVQSQASAPASGTLEPPSFPSKPVDGKINADLSFVLEWQDIADTKAPYSDKGYYYVYWQEGQETTSKFGKMVNSNSDAIGPLAAGKKFFWQVQSCADKNQYQSCGKLSNVWSFTTMAGDSGGSASQLGGTALKSKSNVAWPNSPLGAQFNAASDLTQLVKYTYEWLVFLGGLAAFAALLIAGVQYLTSAGDAGKMGEAKNKIKSAVFGLILLLSSVLILNTINPQLTKLKIPPFEPVSENWIPKVDKGQEPIKCKEVTVYSETGMHGESQKLYGPMSASFQIPSGWEQIKSLEIIGSCNVEFYKERIYGNRNLIGSVTFIASAADNETPEDKREGISRKTTPDLAEEIRYEDGVVKAIKIKNVSFQ